VRALVSRPELKPLAAGPRRDEARQPFSAFQMPLADKARVVARRGQNLCNGGRLAGQGDIVGRRARTVRVPSREQDAAGRGADRSIGGHASEINAFLGQAVKVWRAHLAVAGDA